jgi:integrase/recombinase XerD
MQSCRLKSPVAHVNILKKVRINGTWKLVPVVVELNGRVKDKVRIGDRIEVHPEGTYYIEWWEQNRRKRKSIPYRDRVLDIARRKAFEREATKAGLQIVSETQDKVDNPSKKTRLDLGIRTFLEDIEPPQREPKTYSAYKYCLNLFQSDCSKSYIQDVERQDLLQFIRNQYERGCGARTAYNRVNIVTQFLKLSGVTGLLHRRDWPEYV